jgi:antitoxin VapB
MEPRRKQPSITIRSARAIERLRLLTRDGRSQAKVIEEALERMPLPSAGAEDVDRVIEKLDALSRRIAPELRWRSMAEFDEATYDERGLPR